MLTLVELEQKYFPPELSPGVPNWDETLVIPHVDGEAFFAAIADALDQCEGTGDRIYIASWLFKPDMALRRAAGAPLLQSLLLDKAVHGADVRVIVGTPRFSFGTSAASPLHVEFLLGWAATLGPGAILAKLVSANIRAARALRTMQVSGSKPLNDRILMDWGGHGDSRHEKTTIVYIAKTNELRAFVGGMDYRVDRMADEVHSTWWWHDLGVELREGAAAAALANFVTRWEEAKTLPTQRYKIDNVIDVFNPDIAVTPPTLPTLPPRAMPISVQPGQYLGASVRMVRSYATIRAYNPWLNTSNLPWKTLPATGVQETFSVLKQAIAAANAYIYVEDQLLNPKTIESVYGAHSKIYPIISAACARGVKVIFVTQGYAGPDFPPVSLTMSSEVRDRILGPLTAQQQANFVIYAVAGTKIHSKAMLIDDEFALIGSANFWDRSMTGIESELGAAIVHPGGGSSLVADLRVRLWRGHLRVTASPDIDADLRDLGKSLGMFRSSWGAGVGFPHPNSALREIVP
ncbi:MAG TPA: phospholipase D-like domain-containing protein [Kofleriaceae bacterium]|nr:phospholipase D-like domain-containing protein [Kofleriaceae bacterium]